MAALNSSVRKSLIEFGGKLLFGVWLLLISRVLPQIDLSWFIEKEIKMVPSENLINLPKLANPVGAL